MLQLLQEDVFVSILVPFLTAQDVSLLSETCKRYKNLPLSVWRIVFSLQFPLHKTRNPRVFPYGIATGCTKDTVFKPNEVVDWKRLYRSVVSSAQLFNEDPEKWEAYWCENFRKDNDEIAGSSEICPFKTSMGDFFYSQILHLDKRTLNSFMTTYVNNFNDPRSRRYRHDFLCRLLSHLNFKDMQLEWALRITIAALWLPSSSKGIDRLLHAFSTEYIKQNPGLHLGLDENELYSLCFSLLLLSTDLHNPQVKHKMTCDQWIANTQSVVSAGYKFESLVMERMYASVAQCPMTWKLNTQKCSGFLTLASCDKTLDNANEKEIQTFPIASSILSFAQSVRRTLKPARRVWAELGCGVLSIYENNELILRQSIELKTETSIISSSNSTYISHAVPEKMTADFLLPKLLHKRPEKSYPLYLQLEGRHILLYAENSKERDNWLACLQYNMYHSIYHLDRFSSLFKMGSIK